MYRGRLKSSKSAQRYIQTGRAIMLQTQLSTALVKSEQLFAKLLQYIITMIRTQHQSASASHRCHTRS